MSTALVAPAKLGTSAVLARTCAAEWSRIWSVRSTWLFALATVEPGLDRVGGGHGQQRSPLHRNGADDVRAPAAAPDLRPQSPGLLFQAGHVAHAHRDGSDASGCG